MACAARRSISSKLAAASRARFSPSFSHLFPHDRERDGSHCNPGPTPARPSTPLHQLVPPVLGFRRAKGSGLGHPFSLGGDYGFHRRYSSSSVGSDAGAECVRDAGGFFSDNEVLADNAGEILTQAATAAAPAVGEVAAAAADSAFPVAELQHMIDAVHCFTGLNWWASIALTTVFIRLATAPALFHQLKATAKILLALNAMKPELEEFKEQSENALLQTTDPSDTDTREKGEQIFDFLRKHGVSPFAPCYGVLVQGSLFVSFFFAISNMVEKVPSLKEGGALWFTDLTTPDTFYVFPVLTGLSFLIRAELIPQGNPVACSMKNFFRLFAFMTIPFTASFPKAFFCWWITSILFSHMFGVVLRCLPARKFLIFQGTNPTEMATSYTVICQMIMNLEKRMKQRGQLKKK